MDRTLKEVLTRHGKGGREPSLLSILKEAQDRCGYLSKDVMNDIASSLGIDVGEVYEVATFYSFLSTDPLGVNTIKICKSTPCFLKNCEVIVKAMEKNLGISVDETTEDGRFSLQLTNCIGACDKAPAMMINKKIYGGLTPDRVARILEDI